MPLPLLVANGNEHLKVICLLSGAESDKDIAVQGGGIPLFIASQSGHLEVVRLLSDAGADNDIADQGDATPLLVASGNGHLEVLRLLSDAGADKDIAMQGDAAPLFAHRSVDTWRCSAGSLMQGPRRTSQIRMVAFPLFIAPQSGHLESFNHV